MEQDGALQSAFQVFLELAVNGLHQSVSLGRDICPLLLFWFFDFLLLVFSF